MSDKDYKVTAKELRDNGVEIPMTIADSSWVYRSEIRYHVPDMTSHREGNEMVCNIPVQIDVDFRAAE